MIPLNGKGSVLGIVHSCALMPAFPCAPIQSVVHITRRAHPQPRGDPRHRHQRLLPQSARDLHLAEVAFRALRQAGFRPPPRLQLLTQDSLRLGHVRFQPFVPVGLRAPALRHLRQQLLAKRVLPQTPPPPDRLVIRAANACSSTRRPPDVCPDASNTPANYSSGIPTPVVPASAASPAPDSNAPNRTPSSGNRPRCRPRSPPCSAR